MLSPLPRIFVAGEFTLHPRRNSTLFRHPTAALHLHGYQARLRIGNAWHEIQPGDATLTPGGVESEYTLTSPGKHLCVHFEPARGDVGFCRKAGVWTRLPEAGALWGTVEWVISLERRARPRCGRAAAEMLAAVLSGLRVLGEIPPLSPRRFRSSSAVTEAARRIAGDLENPPDIPALARDLGLSQDYLARRFKEQHGVTLPHFLLLRRMEYARRLLRETTLPVKEIGGTVGVADAQYFNKLFRRFHGVSPSRFRESGGSPAMQGTVPAG